MTDRTRKFFFLVILILAVAGLAGCDSGGDKGGGGKGSPGSFEPEAQARSGDIWLKLEKASATHVTLHVIGDGISGAYGVAGKLIFDTSVLGMEGGGAGTALEGGSASVLAAIKGNDEGGVFGFSRSGDYNHSVDLKADKVIGILEFNVTKKGAVKIAFDPDHSKVMSHELKSVEVTHWLGGTITIK